MLPALIMFLAFAFIPLIGVLVLSFTYWDGIGAIQFTGLQSWVQVLTDPGTCHALWLTFALMIITWLVQTPISLLLGTFIAGQQRYRAVLAVLFFLPLLMSSAAMAIAFKSLLDPNFGLAAGLHLPLLAQDWLGNPTLAFITVVFVIAWQFIPFHTLLYQGGYGRSPTDVRGGSDRRGRAGPAVLLHHPPAAEVHDHHLLHPDAGRVAGLLRPHLGATRGGRQRHPHPRPGHVHPRLPGEPDGCGQRHRRDPRSRRAGADLVIQRLGGRDLRASQMEGM